MNNIKIVSPSKRRLSSLTPLSNYHHDTVKSKQAKNELKRFLNRVVNNVLAKKVKSNESNISLNSTFNESDIFKKQEQDQLYTLSSLTIKNKHDYDDFCSLMLFEKTRRKSSYISTITRKSIKEEENNDYEDFKFIDSPSISLKHHKNSSSDDNLIIKENEFQPEWKKYLKINKNLNIPPLLNSLSTLVS
jgi:hypothetical protein